MVRERYTPCLIGLLVVTASACGGDDGPAGDSTPAGGTGGSAQAQGVSGDGGGGGAGGNQPAPDTCGNAVVDSPLEQCDDGNTVESDGCTALCAFTCSDDTDCDDLDICNGTEQCDLGSHTCGAGEPADNGTRCNAAMSCRDGVCVADSCGDGTLHEDEECDDGDNYDELDGCTTRCTFSCLSSDPARNCADDCNPTAVCDDASHTCSAGTPLDDGTVCDRGQGYCLNGVCMASTCGDGTQDPNEECDLGERNGAPEASCTADCTVATCGDGLIGGSEHCDDGNRDNLDGCDFRCKAEVTFRSSGMGMSMDAAPDFCLHSQSANRGNAFANLFPDPTLIDTTNQIMAQMMENGEMVFLFHIMDVEDISSVVPDPLVRTGLAVGVPEDVTAWTNTPDKLDFPVLVYREFYDAELQPLTVTPAALVVENGRLVGVSTTAMSMGFEISQSSVQGATGTFFMHDIMIRMEIGSSRSKIPAPPETIDSLLVPETVGGDDIANASGIMCGALAEESFAAMGLPQGNLMGLPVPIEMFCLDQLGQYTSCAPGQDPLKGECSSVLDILKGGCSDLGVQFVAPIGEPDADVDGDGVNDAYSIVMKMGGQRIRITGFAEGDPPARPVQ